MKLRDLPEAPPPTRRADSVRVMHGQTIPDPYAWLADEDEIGAWRRGQQNTADAFFGAGDEARAIAGWLERFLDTSYVFHAFDAGPRRFLLIDRPDMGAELAWRNRSGGAITPIATHAPGEILLQDAIFPSPDGRSLAFAVKHAEGDAAWVRVIDVESGAAIAPPLPATVLPVVAWAPDSRAFYYNQNQGEFLAPEHRAPRADGIYLHQLGASAPDQFIMAMLWPDAHVAVPIVADDGTTLFVNQIRLVAETCALYAFALRDNRPAGASRALCAPGAGAFAYIGNATGEALFITDVEAPLGRVVAFDMKAPDPLMRTIVPQGDAPLVFASRAPRAERAAFAADRLFLTTLHDCAHRVLRYTLDGRPDGPLALPPQVSVAGTGGDRYGALTVGDDGASLLISLWRFTGAPCAYEYAIATDTLRPVEPDMAPPKIADARGARAFVARPDGARIPLTILSPTAPARHAPCLLYGYGGSGMPITPEFAFDIAGWLALGGTYVIAHIRGGGEYGAPWHEAAMGPRKQTTFDDFITAAEYLRAEGYAKGGLAIRGISYGGMLVGACLAQRPDLYDAVVAEIPLLDPLSIGSDHWSTHLAPELGNPLTDERAFAAIRAYSPLQNIDAETAYPPTLITLADSDAPLLRSSARQFTATLQNAGCAALLHTIVNAGHGGWTRAQQIDTIARELAFLARVMRLPTERASSA